MLLHQMPSPEVECFFQTKLQFPCDLKFLSHRYLEVLPVLLPWYSKVWSRGLKLMLELGTFQCFFLIKGWYVFVIGLKFLNVFIQFLSPFHVMRNWIGRQYLFMIYELAYICWHMRLVELVSSIHFLCFYVLT